jgi:phospholipid transport system substrate-binding protein
MITRKTFFFFFFTFLFLSVKGIADNVSEKDLSQAKDGKNAENFIQDLGDKGIKTLTGKDLSEGERRKRFEALFVVAFDYDRIGKFVLGRFRRQINEADMKEYLSLFKDMVVRVYAARFGEYNQETFKVSGSRVIDKKVDTMIVSSKIIRPNDSKIALEWHMYQDKTGGFKIFDVVVEGVSMALTQRSEFSAILQQGGIKKLIEDLKVQKNKPQKTKMIQSSAPAQPTKMGTVLRQKA